MGGSGRTEENTMPAELAIQRELEFRRIVAAFHLRPNANSTQKVKSTNDASHPKSFSDPSSQKSSSLSGTKRTESPTSTQRPCVQHQQPFQGIPNRRVKTKDWGFSPYNVKPSNYSYHLKPLSGPNPSKFSKLSGPNPSKFSNLSGIDGKESPTRSTHYPPLQHRPSFNESLNFKAKIDDLYCKICQVSCASLFNLKQHFKGHKHKQMLQKGMGNHIQWCEVCNIKCMNEDLLKLHLQGQKHNTKLQMLEIGKKGGEAPNKPKWCELCKVWCSDELALDQHLKGKRHIIQLYTKEKDSLSQK